MKSPEDRYDYAIRLACDEGYTEAVKILLDLPQIDPANKDNYCIQWASFHGHNDIVGEITLTIVYNVVDWDKNRVVAKRPSCRSLSRRQQCYSYGVWLL